MAMESYTNGVETRNLFAGDNALVMRASGMMHCRRVRSGRRQIVGAGSRGRIEGFVPLRPILQPVPALHFDQP